MLPDDFDGIGACFSPGVSSIATFEEALAERGIPSYMADASVPGVPQEHELFHFQKKYLGCSNDDTFLRLEDWVNQSVNNLDNDLLLQMDIEGWEYPVLLDTPTACLKRFRIVVIEFHALHALFDVDSFRLLNAAFEKMLELFHVVHIHPNNTKPLLSNGAVQVPPVIEVTFYRKDCVERADRSLSFPHPLDETNVPDNPDIVLPECWYR